MRKRKYPFFVAITFLAITVSITFTLHSCGKKEEIRNEGNNIRDPRKIEFAEKFSEFITRAIENIPFPLPTQLLSNFTNFMNTGSILKSPIIRTESENRTQNIFFEYRKSCSKEGEITFKGYFGENWKTTSELQYINCREEDITCGGESFIQGGITSSVVPFCKNVIGEIKGFPADISDYSICFDGEGDIKLNTAYMMKEGITSIFSEWFAEKSTFIVLISGLYQGLYQGIKILMFFKEGDRFILSTPKYYIGIFPKEVTIYINYSIKSIDRVRDESGRGVIMVTESKEDIYIKGVISLNFGDKDSRECMYGDEIEVQTEEPISISIKSEGEKTNFEINSGKIKIGEYLSLEIEGKTLRAYVDGELKKEVKISSVQECPGEDQTAFLCM